MNMSVGELMMYGGAAAFGVLLVMFVIMLSLFKRSRRKLAEKIEKEFDGEQ